MNLLNFPVIVNQTLYHKWHCVTSISDQSDAVKEGKFQIWKTKHCDLRDEFI